MPDKKRPAGGVEPGDTRQEQSPADRYRAQYDNAERRAALDDEAFEARSLEFLLRRFGMMPQVGRALRRSFARRTGRDRLCFSEFHREYPSFPIVLGARRMPGLHTDPKMFLPALFKAFAACPLAVAYERFFEQEAPAAAGRAV